MKRSYLKLLLVASIVVCVALLPIAIREVMLYMETMSLIGENYFEATYPCYVFSCAATSIALLVFHSILLVKTLKKSKKNEINENNINNWNK